VSVIDSDALNAAMTEYVRTTLGTYSIGQTLYRLTDQCLDVLGCDGAGVSISDRDGALRYVTASDDATGRIEAEQAAAQEGPCYEAFLDGEILAVNELEQERRRWPRYVEVAVAQGRRSVLGVPLLADGTAIGVLDIHNRREHAWQDEERETASLLADMAAGYIANLRELEGSRQIAAQLRTALDSRVVIEQAKGVIATRRSVDMDEAFHLLRRASQSTNRKLHDVARDVADGELEV
jgi:GAF domain-containing protein